MQEGGNTATGEARSPNTVADPGGWMSQGTRLDQAGQSEQALAAFEKARALAPADANAASACATLLSVLDLPQAAYRTLLSVEAVLMQDADGATNLAIAAEGCGDLQKAEAAYLRALELDPHHLRALNNLAILMAGASQWDLAIHLARRCISLKPDHPPYHANLAEYLAGARRYAEGLEALQHALRQFPGHAELSIRHIVLTAVTGDRAGADAALKALEGPARAQLHEFLLKLESAESGLLEGSIHGKAADHAADDALQIRLRQAWRNIAIGDWRHQDDLACVLRQALAESPENGKHRDWGDTHVHGLVLDLDESVLLQMRQQTLEAVKNRLGPFPPFKPGALAQRIRRDPRVHVGLAIQSLGDARQVRALEQQLGLHDRARFAVHIYAFGGRPQPLHEELLRRHAASVNELGHMSSREVVGRIRLDRLDIYMELARNPAWTRQEVALVRVAPVQLRQPGLHRHHVAGAWDYLLSDRVIHGDQNGEDGGKAAGGRQDEQHQPGFGPVVRLPETFWLVSPRPEISQPAASREKAGLPPDALVLVSCLLPPLLDAASFAAWMKILRSLPDAVLWLPFCSRAASSLVREAQAAGVSPQRLIFSQPAAWPHIPAHLGCGDLYLDTLRVNATPGLEEALGAGVPALTCRGTTMAALASASVLRAAGLPEGILETPQAYVAEAVRLGRDPRALRALRDKLQAALSTAPLFDIPSRVRDLEAAWTQMSGRARSGLPPEPFDVSPFTGQANH